MFSHPGWGGRPWVPTASAPGTQIVHGVFLLPAATVMGSRCRAAARLLGFAVPCPGLLPLPVTTPLQPPECLTVSACVATGSRGTGGVRAFIFDDGFAAPPGYHGVGGMPDGHVVLIAARARAVSAASYARLTFCLGQPAIRRLLINGDRAVVVACPEGSCETAGHVLLRWAHRGVLAGVSFHNVNATNIGLDIVVARHMVWVSPHS